VDEAGVGGAKWGRNSKKRNSPAGSHRSKSGGRERRRGVEEGNPRRHATGTGRGCGQRSEESCAGFAEGRRGLMAPASCGGGAGGGGGTVPAVCRGWGASGRGPSSQLRRPGDFRRPTGAESSRTSGA
jgi:hypothetical protein